MAVTVTSFNCPLVMIRQAGVTYEITIQGTELAVGMGVQVVKVSDPGVALFDGHIMTTSDGDTRATAEVTAAGVFSGAQLLRLEEAVKAKAEKQALLLGLDALTITVDPDDDPMTPNNVTTTFYRLVLYFDLES